MIHSVLHDPNKQRTDIHHGYQISLEYIEGNTISSSVMELSDLNGLLLTSYISTPNFKMLIMVSMIIFYSCCEKRGLAHCICLLTFEIIDHLN